MPPAMLAMVTLLQAYDGRSDADAVEQTVFDRRWQMVLGCLGSEEAAFSQGVLVDFRERLMRHELDRRLLERTVELAQKSGGFCFKQLRVALDSAPLWGAGRVEDTFNLIAHAMRVVVKCAAVASGRNEAEVLEESALRLVGQESVKAALDIDWDAPEAQHEALQRLLAEVERLREWVDVHAGDMKDVPPLKEALTLLAQVVGQDLEPDPGAAGGQRIARGTAKSRRISVTDGEMRHGRKSRSRLFNGYKRHIALDLDHGLVLAVTARPANEPEGHAAADLRADIEVFGSVDELHIDRAYLSSPWIEDHDAGGGTVVAKPYAGSNRGRFPKSAFDIDLAEGLVTCPEQQSAAIKGSLARFPKAVCEPCPRRPSCTASKDGGRSLAIHPHEDLFIRLRTAKQTREGRATLRQRVAVEHGLAHITRRQGPRARYRGTRKNVFDLRRTAAIENLHTINRAA